jgi:hypothetical protein
MSGASVHSMHVCAVCGRVGTRAFHRAADNWFCDNLKACRSRARARGGELTHTSLVCPECGWLYGNKSVVPSHTQSVRWGADECAGAGMAGITQRERMAVPQSVRRLDGTPSEDT